MEVTMARANLQAGDQVEHPVPPPCQESSDLLTPKAIKMD
jgi:hypothetical protein